MSRYTFQAGADVNTLGHDGNDAILLAAEYGDSKCLEILVNAGADVNKKNTSGKFPILLALNCQQKYYIYSLRRSRVLSMNYNRSKCLELLISADADLNLQDQDGKTALMWVARRGQHKHFEILLRAGIDVNIRDKSGRTALLEAVGAGHHECVKLLLAAGS